MNDEAEKLLAAGKKLSKKHLTELFEKGIVYQVPVGLCVLVSSNSLFEVHAQLLSKLYQVQAQEIRERVRGDDYSPLFIRMNS